MTREQQNALGDLARRDPLIIGSQNLLRRGQVIRPQLVGDVFLESPLGLMVLRESSVQEYMRVVGKEPPAGEWYFYEVTTD